MCLVSNVGDYFKDITIPTKYPWVDTVGATTIPVDYVGRAEFDSLKKTVEELVVLIKAAKKYDEVAGEPDCEVDDKVELIKRLAKELGVDLKGVFEYN